MFDINDKIEVFISSDCKKKEYIELRGLIKELLEKKGFIKTYVFEKDVASTSTAEDRYLDKLDECHVILFLIDNQLENGAIPPGVMKEYRRANDLNKKALYLFCNSTNKRKTIIQEEIINKSGKAPKYYDEVTEFKEFVNKSIDSVISDIVGVYKLYCRDALVRPDTYDQNKEIPSSININQEHFVSSHIDKQYFKNFTKSKNLIWETIFNKNRKLIKTGDFIDEFTSIFLQHLIGKISFSALNLENFKSNLKREKINSFSLKRWEAIEAYYNDDLKTAIKILYKLYDKNFTDIPEWVKNNILIDIRYIENINFRKNNQLGIPQAQSKLDSSDTFLAFPIIDRLGYEIYEQILSEIFEIETKLPGSFRMSNSLKEIFEKIEKYIFASVYYGSLVNILLSRQLLMEATFHFSQYYTDSWLRYFCMGMAILNGEPGKIKKIFSHLISYFNVSSYDKINNMYNLTNILPVGIIRNEMKLTVLQIIGYYFSDEDYSKCEDEVFKIANFWIEDEQIIVSIGFQLIEFMKKNIERIDTNKVLKFALTVLEKKLLRFYDDIFRMLIYLNWNSASNVLIKGLIIEIESLIKDKEQRKKFSNLGSLIISIRKNCTKSAKRWDSLIQKEWVDFYRNVYNLGIIDLTKDTAKTYILEYANQIKERNKTQGKNGKYSIYGNNPQQIIINIINNPNAIEIDFDSINRKLLPILLEVLHNKQQSVDEKVYCFKLLMNLESKCKIGKYECDWTSFSNQIFKNKNEVLSANEVVGFGIYSSSILKLYSFFYETINGYQNEQEALSIFAELSSSDKLNSINFIKGINDYIRYFEILGYMEINYLSYILQIVFSKSYDQYFQIRSESVACLGALCSTSFKDTIISRLSEMIEDPDYRVRLKVLWQLDKIRKISKPYFNYIIQKAKVDNNFIIRSWLKRNL